MAVKKPPVQYTKTRDGVRIAFCVAGDGPPLLRSTIVGATHTEYDWDIFFRVLPRLAEHFRVAWYDARGTGNSERTVTSFGFDEMMLDIDAVASVVGFHRFAVLGFASGASIALEYAARNPETVASLVVVDGAMAGPATMTRLNTARAMAELDWDVYTETMAKVLLAIDEPDYVRQLAEMYKATTTQDTYLRYYDESSNWHPRLDTIEQPTLVVNNRNLPWAPLEVSQEIAAGVRGARLVRIDDPLYETIPDMIAEFLLGSDQRGKEASASPFRTVLFTDIVGHTAIMQRLGDGRGRDLLREHELITRELLAEHGGAEVKTMGDGFMASFASVTKAMDCAIALQRAFAAREGEPLQIRVGLNAGEPIEEDGDLFGAAVILASRICGQAGAGEILVPEPVRHLLAGKSYVYADRGDFIPKGFEDRMRLYEVRWQ